MEKTQNAIASASNINVLSTFNQDSLSSMMDTVRHTALRGYSKAQQDDILGDALLHLCEKASDGYFSDVKALNVLSAKCFVILRNKAGDERDKIQTFRKHLDIVPKDISDVFDGKFDLAEDVDDFEDQKDSITRYINALPGKEGDVMRLTFEGYSDDEIMSDLNMSRNSVQKARCVARSKVIKFMKSSEYGRSNSSSKTRPSAEADASADFFYTYSKILSFIPLLVLNYYEHTMKSLYVSKNNKRSKSLIKSISEERLCFKGGIPIGSISIKNENNNTKRMIRRIIEKRVNQSYWGCVHNHHTNDNRHRSSSKRYLSRVTGRIFDGQF